VCDPKRGAAIRAKAYRHGPGLTHTKNQLGKLIHRPSAQQNRVGSSTTRNPPFSHEPARQAVHVMIPSIRIKYAALFGHQAASLLWHIILPQPAADRRTALPNSQVHVLASSVFSSVFSHPAARMLPSSHRPFAQSPRTQQPASSLLILTASTRLCPAR